ARILTKEAAAAGPGRRDRLAGLHETLALGGQSERACRALDQAHTELRLDPLQPGADRRRCLVEVPGGLAQRPRVRDAKEEIEIIELHDRLCEPEGGLRGRRTAAVRRHGG